MDAEPSTNPNAQNLDSTEARKLTDNRSTDAMPAWSQDGQYIYFLNDRNGGWGIRVMQPDGANPRKIQSIGAAQYWQWFKLAVGWNRQDHRRGIQNGRARGPAKWSTPRRR